MENNINNDGEFTESDSSIVVDYNYNQRLLPNYAISLDTLTESLGFESFNEKSKCSFEEVVQAAKRRSRTRTNTEKCTNNAAVTDFPPLLSSLNENGRPRFNLEKVRENGRLQISCVIVTLPEVIVGRTLPGEGSDGRVRIKFIDEELNKLNNSSSSGKEEIIQE